MCGGKFKFCEGAFLQLIQSRGMSCKLYFCKSVDQRVKEESNTEWLGSFLLIFPTHGRLGVSVLCIVWRNWSASKFQMHISLCSFTSLPGSNISYQWLVCLLYPASVYNEGLLYYAIRPIPGSSLSVLSLALASSNCGESPPIKRTDTHGIKLDPKWYLLNEQTHIYIIIRGGDFGPFLLCLGGGDTELLGFLPLLLYYSKPSINQTSLNRLSDKPIPLCQPNFSQ